MSEKINCLSCDCCDPSTEGCTMPECDREYACSTEANVNRRTERCIDADRLAAYEELGIHRTSYAN